MLCKTLVSIAGTLFWALAANAQPGGPWQHGGSWESWQPGAPWQSSGVSTPETIVVTVTATTTIASTSSTTGASTKTISPSAVGSDVASAETTLPLFKNASYPYLGNAPPSNGNKFPAVPFANHCVVVPRGFGEDDSAQILAAVNECGTNGVITLPAPYVYTIARRMYMRLNNARLEIFGTLSFEANLNYWIENSFRVEFQNQSTAWIVEGHDYEITGGGWQRGGIDGNGQAWMTRAAGHSNQFGRPISLSIYNSTNVVVRDFSFRQPQFWSIWVQDSSHLDFTGIYINGTNTDPAGNGSNYETNIDGFDSIRTHHATFSNWLFMGGDDCMAPKGNSTDFTITNMTCIGGGFAFGSIGQYAGAPDYISNFTVKDVTVGQNVRADLGGASVAGGAYFKSWVGVAAGVPPQGGGGGGGLVNNVTFSNLTVHNITQAVYINKCYYKVASQAQYCDTSPVEFAGLNFDGVYGTVSGKTGILFNCSAAAPCQDLTVQDVRLTAAKNVSVSLGCVNVDTLSGAACNSTITT